jgi:hypothetical protein
MRYSDRERRERFALARAFEHSNMTKAEYCRRHGLSVNSFDYWSREAAKEEPQALEPTFFEIQVTDSQPVAATPRQPDLEVELPLGVKLRFFGSGVAR